jgi:hypothetical protein
MRENFFHSEPDEHQIVVAMPIAETPEQMTRRIQDRCSKFNLENDVLVPLRIIHGENVVDGESTWRQKLDQLWANRFRFPYSGEYLFPTNSLGFWDNVQSQDEDPLSSDLAIRLLTSPASEACCERCFSHLRRYYRKHRRSLSIQRLQHELFIKEQHRKEAVDVWSQVAPASQPTRE